MPGLARDFSIIAPEQLLAALTTFLAPYLDGMATGGN
jgi:hypothetical protein